MEKTNDENGTNPALNKADVSGSAEREAAMIRMNKLTEAVKPLIKLLSEEYHPHHTAIVTSTSVELLEGVCSVPKIYDYLVD